MKRLYLAHSDMQTYSPSLLFISASRVQTPVFVYVYAEEESDADSHMLEERICLAVIGSYHYGPQLHQAICIMNDNTAFAFADSKM